MDANSLSYCLEFVAGGGSTLSVEDRAAFQSSLVILRKNHDFHRVLFWGKIVGGRDYYIAQGRGEDEMKETKYLYSLNCMDWLVLPAVTDVMIADMSKAVKGLFTGDPSHLYEHMEVVEGSTEEKVTKVNEEERLAVAIHLIDKEASVVPRGAYIKNPCGLVQTNRRFEGLTNSEAGKLDNYFHFTVPGKLKKKTVLEMAELSPSIDFLEPLSDDNPKGCWSLQFECAGRVCVIRSLLWLGLTSFHVPLTTHHGYIYIGDGTKNLDLPLML
ncbi:radial spoke head protein 9 homolog isoform X2 [Genypterus blacodes]|uniref:radial spoke head protein 9 homolog isoform X2 n=1 Tax=Genypterus blacodes TaxID=154954 RepID=UPI003F7766D3